MIPLYGYDGSYVDHITAKRAARLESMGRARVVRHRKGHVNRVVLYRQPGDPDPTSLQDYQGQAYSFEQPLRDGHHCWKLRPLQGGRSDVNLAPEDLRPIFVRVLTDCLSAAGNDIARIASNPRSKRVLPAV